MSVECSGRTARVSVSRYLREPATLIAFLKVAFELAGDFTGKTEGIQFEVQETTREGVCQVCGQAMTERIVHCRKCKTPHHRECWEYLRVCSTFGCGERRCQ